MDPLLVVTADDVGLHAGMTDGALAAYDDGIVTTCSVVAGGPDLERAARELRARPGLEVGLHFALAGAPLVSPAAEVRTLAPGGQPLADHRAFLVRLATGRIDLADVERELRRQIARALDAGIPVTHLDGHQHLHVVPGVVHVVARVAREHRIAYVRVPLERVPPHGARGLAVWGLGQLARRARRTLRAAGIATNDTAIGLAHAGHLTPARLRQALSRLDGTTELVAHPGVGNARIARSHDWGYDWDGERETLSAAGLREEILGLGIALAGTSEIARRARGALPAG
ncbi:MAG: hypothetical protein A3H36_03475 [Chloroflexi bacterium RIFCSPLOWO2_02_FULL_71_16]|nr:MAG: hypothetical protein A3H36_03475 [Chloroflexi bacterium RIFCSPLOWO2_02_FULL_71_16]OGT93562.1 MAG: hypothetical protein A2083_02540 [Gemmatimonadetes bacterium GWC2_71_9]